MSRLRKILCGFLVVVGIIIAFLPQISNYIFTRQTDVVVKQYASNYSDEELEALWNEAVNRNMVINNASNVQGDTREFLEYEEQLYVDGIMGYISIPKISVQLPIYHGTKESVLSKGVGHLENSSLPVGGNGTHCVLTGHTGLSTAKLFNGLDKLEEGDYFYLTVAGHVLTYVVDNIKKVEPSESELLKSEVDKDYCTLVTCTPYGVNTHRLLVRGARVNVDNGETSYYISETKDVYLLTLILLIFILAIIALLIIRKKRNEKKNG